MPDPIFFEDFRPGRHFTAGPVTVEQAEIIDFARRYDPQPFHTDPEAAAAHPVFRGHAASGWLTAALSMRMVVEAMGHAEGGVIGAGGEIAWPRPTRPGDRLTLDAEVLEATPSRSRPDRGTVLLRNRTLNQAGEEVQVFTVRIVVARRPVSG